MSKWLRPLTYGISALCGVASVIFPATAAVLIPVATGLAGWATMHPADATSAAALAELARVAAETAVANAKK